jgi:hypothetical protein
MAHNIIDICTDQYIFIYLFIYLFMVYLMTMSVALNGRMINEWTGDDSRGSAFGLI